MRSATLAGSASAAALALRQAQAGARQAQALAHASGSRGPPSRGACGGGNASHGVARASGRTSQVGTNYHSRPAASLSRGPPSRGACGGGGYGGGGGGGGSLAGGGGISTSNRTSADNPLASPGMMSHQAAYRDHR